MMYASVKQAALSCISQIMAEPAEQPLLLLAKLIVANNVASAPCSAQKIS
jgi:hypothetical protein